MIPLLFTESSRKKISKSLCNGLEKLEVRLTRRFEGSHVNGVTDAREQKWLRSDRLRDPKTADSQITKSESTGWPSQVHHRPQANKLGSEGIEIVKASQRPAHEVFAHSKYVRSSYGSARFAGNVERDERISHSRSTSDEETYRPPRPGHKMATRPGNYLSPGLPSTQNPSVRQQNVVA